ncbi:MAG TPA: alpha/beta hydrolase [Streptosporangiaceae bacterium]|nr:alpha/beta hydrolase [Streptosporangiaceae bacterium]
MNSSASPEGPGSVPGAPNLPTGFTGTFTSRYIGTGDLRQHVVTGGDGPPLLLVHGWPQTWYAWRLVMPALARDFTVIVPDQRGNANVKALVYDDAYIPAATDTLLVLTSAEPGSCLAVSPAPLNMVPYPGAPSGDVDLYVKQSVFPGCFANGLPAAEARVLAATQRPLAHGALTEPSGMPAWKPFRPGPSSARPTT